MSTLLKVINIFANKFTGQILIVSVPCTSIEFGDTATILCLVEKELKDCKNDLRQYSYAIHALIGCDHCMQMHGYDDNVVYIHYSVRTKSKHEFCFTC